MLARELHDFGHRFQSSHLVAEQMQRNQIAPGTGAGKQDARAGKQESIVKVLLGWAEPGVDVDSRDVEPAILIHARRLQLVSPKDAGSGEKAAVAYLVQSVGGREEYAIREATDSAPWNKDSWTVNPHAVSQGRADA